MVTVTNLRYWSNPNYTRVVIDADREASYYHHLLKKDPSINKPQRLYVDLASSRLGKNIRKSIPIGDDLLSNARAGQYTPDSVRVVVDIKSFETYKIFSLKDPFRIVIDVWGSKEDKVPEVPGPSETIQKGGKIPPGSLTKQLALGVRRVIIDPGHGGKDLFPFGKNRRASCLCRYRRHGQEQRRDQSPHAHDRGGGGEDKVGRPDCRCCRRRLVWARPLSERQDQLETPNTHACELRLRRRFRGFLHNDRHRPLQRLWRVRGCMPRAGLHRGG